MSLPVPEFSHIVNVQDLPQDGADYDISANEAECVKLAERFNLVRLSGLKAVLRLDRRSRGAVRLSGGIVAQVTQTCVATLDPVDEDVEIDLDIVFQPDFEDLPLDAPEYDSERDLEPLTGDSLDIGEIVAEEMALSLNPYPRAATAPMIGPDGADAEEGPAPQRPFAGLGTLIQKHDKI
jgi:uncharacterized metal-binding protein YceD (DUF177 family)